MDGPGATGGSGGLPGSGGSSGGSVAGEGGSAVMGGAGGVAGAAAAGGESGGAGGEPSKVILFDGSPESFNDWTSIRIRGVNPWKNNGDGTMSVVGGTGDIESVQLFRNVFVHLEYLTPQMPDTGSEIGNASGDVFLNGSYGLRMTNSHGLPPTVLSCGSVYGYHAPLEVACHELGVWNTFEIEFQAPTCDDGSSTTIEQPARFIEVRLNGTTIHRDVDVLQPTQAGHPESCEPRAVRLQDYAAVVPASFRNIWAIRRD
jgi:hypothetical protein